MSNNKLYHIYSDESRQCEHRYMVIGGIMISDDQIERFNSTMKKYRLEMNMMSELKWSKVTNQKYDEYKRFIDYFFALNDNDIIQFRCIVIDTHQVNHKKFNDGNKEIGFYKFHYQLFLNCFGRSSWCEGVKFIIRPDQRNSKYPLSELKKILNNGFNKHIQSGVSPFVSIEPIDSKVSEVVQINDLILGAIGFHKNGVHLISGTRQSKIDLSAYIALKAGRKDLGANTPYGNYRFTIWNIKLQK